MEYCGGVDLFDKIVKNNDSFSEQKVADIMKCLFLAMNHCHSNNVAHRDLKPENIMCDGDQIKIIDFGLSKQKSSNQRLKTIVGTPFYVAPEVLSGDYDFECDNWSLGVIMYVLLSGYLPFHGSNDAEVFAKIKTCQVSFDQTEFSFISETAKDLIRNLLKVDKYERFTCA